MKKNRYFEGFRVLCIIILIGSLIFGSLIATFPILESNFYYISSELIIWIVAIVFAIKEMKKTDKYNAEMDRQIEFRKKNRYFEGFRVLCITLLCLAVILSELITIFPTLESYIFNMIFMLVIWIIAIVFAIKEMKKTDKYNAEIDRQIELEKEKVRLDRIAESKRQDEIRKKNMEQERIKREQLVINFINSNVMKRAKSDLVQKKVRHINVKYNCIEVQLINNEGYTERYYDYNKENLCSEDTQAICEYICTQLVNPNEYHIESIPGPCDEKGIYLIYGYMVALNLQKW